MESCVRERAPAPSCFWAAVHGGLGRARRPRGGASCGAPSSTCSGIDCHRPRPTKGRQEPSCGVVSWTAGTNPHSRRARSLRSCPRPDGAAYKLRTRPPGRSSQAGSPGRGLPPLGGRGLPALMHVRMTPIPATGHLRPSSSDGWELPRLPPFLAAAAAGPEKARVPMPLPP
jgi:hypothetical protein